jgi:hypothetical protein
MMDTRTKSQTPDDEVNPAGGADQIHLPSNRWLSADWSTRSWWIKAPFLLAVAATIIGAQLGAHFAFEWLKHHWRHYLL